MSTTYLGLGSNVDARANIASGIEALRKAFGAVGVTDRLDVFGDIVLTTSNQAQTPAAPARR